MIADVETASLPVEKYILMAERNGILAFYAQNSEVPGFIELLTDHSRPLW